MAPLRAGTRPISRRRFLTVGGGALALSRLPFACAVALGSEPHRQDFGGRTPNADFYVTSYGSTPSVDVKTWRLRISGLVKNPLAIGYEQIKSLPAVRETLTLECISNPPDGSAIGNARWVGPALRPLLERAGVNSKAAYAALHGADGYFTGVPVDEILRHENFLPYLMNGEALPPDHGFPVRLFIPGKYGMKQPKWLTEIALVDHEFLGYWEQRGWSNSAWRKVNSGFFSPRSESLLPSLFGKTAKVKAPLDIYGWALAGPSGIRRVEVSTDAGTTFFDADLLQNRSPYVWTVWKYRFTPSKPGRYQVRVRATDGNGVAQPVEDPQRGRGMSGQPRITLDVSAV